MKYIRLLRLQDQYILIGIILASAVYFRLWNQFIFFWGVSAISISIAAFIINEIVDQEDTDKYSWNPIHIRKNEKLNFKAVVLIFAIFSVLGIGLGYLSGLFWWGIGMYVVGIGYSLKPIRLKGRFALDIIAQILVWIVLPFAAVAWKSGQLPRVLPLLLFASCLWSIIFPYQLADYDADQKAKLANTHVIIGMRNSLVFGLILAVISIILFFVFKIFVVARWSWFFFVVNLFALTQYIRWLRMKHLAKQLKSLQDYVRTVKPLGYLIVPYFLLWIFI